MRRGSALVPPRSRTRERSARILLTDLPDGLSREKLVQPFKKKDSCFRKASHLDWDRCRGDQRSNIPSSRSVGLGGRQATIGLWVHSVIGIDPKSADRRSAREARSGALASSTLPSVAVSSN